MTLKQFANVDACLFDKSTKKEISHEEYLHRIVTKLGTERVKLCVPFTKTELKEALMKNSNFNTIPAHCWEQAKIATIFLESGITKFTSMERLAVLKYAAKLICKGE